MNLENIKNTFRVSKEPPSFLKSVLKGTSFYYYILDDKTPQYAYVYYRGFDQDELIFEPMTLFSVMVECSTKVPNGNNFSSISQYINLPYEDSHRGRQYDKDLSDMFS